ncbi:MAG: DUF192 domain-containing protein [candidate division SR1 bacterium]|nr:DUF192 domain-containing protein [candidate division SR1 bacterium]
MKKKIIFWAKLIILIIISVFFYFYFKQITYNQNIKKASSPNQSEWFTEIEIANTPISREKGLMNRSSLCKSCGMIFIFDKSQPLNFWMKNTQIPLDMIFVNEKNRVVSIHENTIPFQTSPTYSSQSEARYVIETNAYFTKEHGIAIGSTIDIEKLISSSVSYKN